MGSPVSPVITNIYMEYFEEMVLGPQCPITTLWWKRYVDNVISIVKKDKVYTLFNHLNSVDTHIKFTMQTTANDGSIPFLDTKSSLNPHSTISTSVFRKNNPHQSLLGLELQPSNLSKKAVIQALTYRAKNVCSTSQILAKEIGTTFTNYYAKTPTKIGSLKIQKRNQHLLLKNLILALKSIEKASSLSHMSLASVRNSEEFSDIPVYRSLSKELTP